MNVLSNIIELFTFNGCQRYSCFYLSKSLDNLAEYVIIGASTNNLTVNKMNYPKLVFGEGNAKLDHLAEKYNTRVFTFSLMSGHTCPYAKDCHSKAVFDGIKWGIQDGPYTQFRCFSASQEVLFPAVRESRIANGIVLEYAAQQMGDIKAGELLIKNMPAKAGIVRIHVGGDFATQNYFDAWCYVANKMPHIKFYAYTKALPFWVKRLGKIPSNLVLTASYGGYRDDLIAKHNLRFAKVVFSEVEAGNLPIDHDDSHAVENGPSFALLIHGVQPAGSDAGKAVRELNGKGSYAKAGA